MLSARMEGSSLDDARMLGASLWNAGIENATAVGLRMQGASLRSARMNGANLSRARMEGAKLLGSAIDNTTKMRAVTFHGAAIQSVDLVDIQITQEQLDSAFADGSVTLPEGLNRPAHWPSWVLPNLKEPSFREELEKWQNDPASYTPPPPSP